MKDLKIKKIVIICCAFILCVSNIPNQICYASVRKYLLGNDYSKEQVYVSQILFDFEMNSKKIRQVENNYSLKAVDSLIAYQNQSASSDSMTQIQAMLQSLQATKDELQYQIDATKKEFDEYIQQDNYDEEVIKTYEDQILLYQSQITTAEQEIKALNNTYLSSSSSYYNNTLDSEIKNFYVVNRSLFEQEEKNRLKYDFLTKLLSMMVIREQQEYCNAYGEHLKTQEKVESIKEKYGLKTDSNKISIKVDIDKNRAMQEGLSDSYEDIVRLVEEETILTNRQMILEYDLQAHGYSLITLEETFLERNTTYLKSKHNIQAYQHYMNSGINLSSLEKQQIEEVIKSYEIQKGLLEQEIRRYVKSLLNTYKQTISNLEVLDKELSGIYQQIASYEKAYKNGRITLLEVETKRLQAREKETEFYKAVMKKQQLEYIIENYIYGVFVE